MKILFLFVFMVKVLFSQDINCTHILTVDLAKKCEVLMLHVSPERKSKKIATCASIGDKVINLGCKRDITQDALDKMDKIERDYMSWKHPVWCKVSVGKKEGWVQKQYLKEEKKLENHE